MIIWIKFNNRYNQPYDLNIILYNFNHIHFCQYKKLNLISIGNYNYLFIYKQVTTELLFIIYYNYRVGIILYFN